MNTGSQNYNQAKHLMSLHPALCDFLGPQPEELVLAAERALGLTFPETYKRFLLEYGAGRFGSTVIDGVVKEGFDNPGTPDAIWQTLATRRETEFPANYVIIYHVGDGEVFCISCAESGEAPIIAFTPGIPIDLQVGEIIAADFGDFLLARVNDNLKRKTL